MANTSPKFKLDLEQLSLESPESKQLLGRGLFSKVFRILSNNKVLALKIVS